jgi:hypothetical protein
MPIPIRCPSCASKLRAPDNWAGRKTKCPKCGNAFILPTAGTDVSEPLYPLPLPQPIEHAEPTTARPKPRRAPVSAPADADFDFEASSAELGQIASCPEIQRIDIPGKIATCAAGVALLLLGVSPLFNWVNFGNGGVIGLKGDGKIVLGLSLAAMAIYIMARVHPQKGVTILQINANLSV